MKSNLTIIVKAVAGIKGYRHLRSQPGQAPVVSSRNQLLLGSSFPVRTQLWPMREVPDKKRCSLLVL